jgi:hypothetical protein
MTNPVQSFLYDLITRQADETARAWLDQKFTSLTNAFSKQAFYLTFAATPRFVGKNLLRLTSDDFAKANELCAGFLPESWTVDRATRVFFMLCLPTESPENHVNILDTLFQTAEINELVALYSALPLLPFPERYVNRCAEGIRTNMTVVFEAIALNNPFPAAYLSENAWNQLFLKAIFTGRQITKIQGIKHRANANLAQICADYAHERWAAGRKVSPELWMPIANFVDVPILEDLKRLKESTDVLQKQAFTLVCMETNHVGAKELLTSMDSLKEAVEKNEFSWETIARQWHQENPS